MMVAMVSLTAMPCDQKRVGPSTMARFSAVMLFSSLWSAIVERWSRTAYRLDLEQGGLNMHVNTGHEGMMRKISNFGNR